MIASLALQERVVAEGAVAIAALARVTGRRRGAIASGGNIDGTLLGRLVAAAPTSPSNTTNSP